MRPGTVEQGPGRGPARLVPQPDGYAEYADPREARQAGPGQHRSARRQSGPTRNIQTGSFRIKGVPSAPRRRQRSIRSTIMALLVLPVLTMIGLYGYAVSGTIAPAIAKQSSAAVNADIGQTFATMVQAIEAEQADSFAWQASYHHDPQANMPRDYKNTDLTVQAFLAGDTRAQGVESPQTKLEDPKLRAALAGLPGIRAKAATAQGPAGGLATFKSYLGIQHVITEFSTGLANPNASIAENEESQVLIEAGTGTQDVADVGTLLGGVLAGGDEMIPAEYKEFQQLYWDQQVNFGLVDNPLYWQVSPDPYSTSVDGHLPAMNTPQVKAVLNLEAEVLQEGSSTHPVSIPLTLDQLAAFGGALAPPNGPLTVAEDESRLAITANDNHQGDVILWRLAIVGGVGLLVVLLSTVLLLRFGNRITRELTGLRNAARTLSGERLPSVVRRLRAGDDVDVAAEAPPLDLRTRTREVTDTADAFSAVQHTAIQAAVEQATLRRGVANVFRSLARRNQSLVQRQLKMLDEMEQGTQDPDALGQLFRLDHLTTRMRRHAEGLIILSGAAPGRRWRQPVPVVEVLRGAISEIEDYVRVDLVTDSPDYLTGAAVADVTHLLAELIENAVVYSPPATRVQVRGGRVANGYVIEIEDRGLGIPPAARDGLNERLAQPPDFDLTDSDQLGLFVVSRLAVRNGIRVSLRESGFGGTTAIVLLPGALVVSEQEAGTMAAEGGRGDLGSAGRPTDGEGVPGEMSGARRAPRLDRPVNAQEGEAPFGSGPAGVAAAARQPFGARSTFGGDSPFGGDGSAFGGGSSRPPRAGRGAFGNPAPFEDAPASAPQEPAVRRSSFEASAGDGGGQSAGEGPAGLPRRQKMASLAPQLRESRPEPPKAPLAERSPEQARALLSSIQRGLRTGRDTDPAGPGKGTGNGGGITSDPGAQDAADGQDGAGNGTGGRGDDIWGPR